MVGSKDWEKNMGAEICVKSPSQSEELCAGSDVTLAEAQSECSALADAKFYVLVNWGGPKKGTTSENLQCHPHSEDSDLYICAAHQGGHTWMVGYTIATHDATPVRHSGRYHLHKEKPIDPSSIGATWDSAGNIDNGNSAQYAVQKFTIIRAVKRPFRSFPPIPTLPLVAASHCACGLFCPSIHAR